MTRFYCAATSCIFYEMGYTSRPPDEGNCTRKDTQIDATGKCRDYKKGKEWKDRSTAERWDKKESEK